MRSQAKAAPVAAASFLFFLMPLARAGAQTPPASPYSNNVPPANASPLDEPLRLMRQANQVYGRVQDYTCTMLKQERIGGRLQPEHVVSMKFRKQPFSVYMKWHSPKKFAGQEVCYVHGKNGNKMRVRSKGLLGALGFMSISLNDPRARQHSRHVITESGIGNVIAKCIRRWIAERQRNRARAQVSDYQFANRRCKRIEVIMTRPLQGDYCCRTVIYLDEQTRLPVRVECYGWPRRDAPQGDLLEVFSYVNVRFNVGLTEKDFRY